MNPSLKSTFLLYFHQTFSRVSIVQYTNLHKLIHVPKYIRNINCERALFELEKKESFFLSFEIKESMTEQNTEMI